MSATPDYLDGLVPEMDPVLARMMDEVRGATAPARAGAPHDEGPALESWSEFRDSATDETPMLVDGIAPAAGIGILGAPPKTGKTWIALDLGVAVATGTPFLGRFTVPEPRPVLYVALEGGRRAIRARIGAIARGAGIDPAGDGLKNLHIAYRPRGLNLSDPDWSAWLVEKSRKVGAALVVVDVLRRAATIRESGDGATDFAGLLRNLEGLLSEDCLLLFTHHFGKGGEQQRGRSNGDKLAGSGALFGAADLLVYITESLHNARSLRLAADARDFRPPAPFVVDLVGEPSGGNGTFLYDDTVTFTCGIARPEVDVMAEAIAAMMRKARAEGGKPVTKVAAAAAVGTGRTTTAFSTAWGVAEASVADDPDNGLLAVDAEVTA